MTDRRIAALSVKALGDAGTFEGYASVFGAVDSYADVVLAGAFDRSLRESQDRGRMPALLWQHDPATPIGVWEDMREDETGLLVRGRIADTSQGRDAYALLKMGALSGLSIGFRTVKARINKASQVRELLDLDLVETSLVTFPASDAARVESVKATDWDVREWEVRLREALGLSRAQANVVIARGVKALLSESEPPPSRDAEMAAQIHAIAARLRAKE